MDGESVKLRTESRLVALENQRPCCEAVRFVRVIVERDERGQLWRLGLCERDGASGLWRRADSSRRQIER